MNFSETLLFYLVIGLGVAAAQWSAGRIENAGGRNLAALAAVPFWPLFLPLLLSGDRRPAEPPVAPTAPDDRLAREIQRVETELGRALASLAGEQAVSPAVPDERLAELHEALSGQADRIRRMDDVLARGSIDLPPTDDPSAATTAPLPAGNQASQEARRANLLELGRLRREAEIELRTNLDRIRELASQAHLAEFGGAPPGRAAELLAEIAAMVKSMAARL